MCLSEIYSWTDEANQDESHTEHDANPLEHAGRPLSDHII